MQRPLPQSIAALRIPNREYDYFSDHASHPFHPEDKGLSLTKAWWMAELCLLSYVRETDFIEDRLTRAGFTGMNLVDKAGFRALIALAPHHAILTFRGTMFREPSNILADAKVRLVEDPRGGQAHGGFSEALNLLWPDIEPRIRAAARTRRLWVTGHSMGAALATLAVRRDLPALGVGALGSPRVGDDAFARTQPPVPHWRIVHQHDIVCYLPPPWRYRHVGQVVHLTRTGEVRFGLDAVDRIREGVRDRISTVLRGEGGWQSILKRAIGENALSDHAPVNYALRLWNALHRS